MRKQLRQPRTNAGVIAIGIRTAYTLVTEYKGLQHYKPFRIYNGQKARHILRRLGSDCPLPKMNHCKTVINNGRVKVFIVRDKDGYYFYEYFAPLTTKVRLIN